MNEDNTKYAKWGLVALLTIGGLLAVFFRVGQDQPGAIATSVAVQVPAAINTAITVGIAALLALGLSWVFKVFGLDLRGQAPILALAISSFVTAELQNIINIIPAQYDIIVNTVLYVLVLILAPAGFMYAIAKKKNDDPDPASLI